MYLKVVIVGDAATGKSAILNRFDEYPHFSVLDTNKYNPTKKIEFSDREFSIDQEVIKLYVWDTPTQEPYCTFSPFYYKGANAFIITYDITNRESFDHVPQWIEAVRKEQPDAVIYVVGTKQDKVALDASLRAVQPADAEVWANLQSTSESPVIYRETNAKDNAGIEDLFETVTKRGYQDTKAKIEAEKQAAEAAPSLWNPFRTTEGIVAGIVIAVMLAAVLAATAPIWLPFVAALTLGALIGAAIIAVATVAVGSLIAAYSASACAGSGKSAAIETDPDFLLLTGTYSRDLSASGVYDPELDTSGAGLGGSSIGNSTIEQVRVNETYAFESETPSVAIRAPSKC